MIAGDVIADRRRFALRRPRAGSRRSADCAPKFACRRRIRAAIRCRRRKIRCESGAGACQRKQIENTAAHGELSARGDLRHAFVTGGNQRFDHALQRLAFSAPQNQRPRSCSAAGVGRRLIKRRARGDDDVRTFFALDAGQKREPFGRDLRIGQDIFDRGEFGFRQEERVGQPVEQTLVKQFLRADIRDKGSRMFSEFRRRSPRRETPGPVR